MTCHKIYVLHNGCVDLGQKGRIYTIVCDIGLYFATRLSLGSCDVNLVFYRNKLISLLEQKRIVLDKVN